MDSAVVEIILRGKDELSGTLEKVGRSVEGLHGSLSRIKDIALGNILGNLGTAGIEDVVRGVVDFGRSMIDTNAQIELMHQRLNILYQSTAEGAQAFAFLKQNELTKPFDIQSILQAATQLVAFKQDITTVLPALEDVAGAMGQTLPTAAQAFTDAMAGRFQMMKRDLGISKEQLVAFGLEMNKAGHVTNPESFVSAFLALAQSGEFKGGADKLAQTWTGLMSSMSSQWTYFKANLGQGAFAVLEQQLSGVVHTLQNPQNAAAIQRFEQGIGAALGAAMADVIAFARAFAPYLGSAILVGARAWDLVHRGASQAFALVGTAVSGFANWLQGTAFPVIERVINAVGNAWIAMQPAVVGVLTAIGNDFSTFVRAIGGIAAPAMQAVAGAFAIGMGAVQAIFGGSLNLLSGNWASFQKDFSDGANLVVKGMVGMVAGLSIALLPLAEQLLDPWTAMAQGIRSVFTAIAPFVGPAMAALAIAITAPFRLAAGFINLQIGLINAALHVATGAIDALIDKYNGLVGLIPGMGGHKLPKIGGAGDIPMIDMGNGIDLFTGVNDAVQKAMRGVGIGPNQRITAGRTEGQAAADIDARAQRILAEVGLLGGGGKPTTFSTSGGPGAEILAQIKGLFAGIGGTMTFTDFMKAMGLTDLGKGLLSYNGAGGAGAGLTWNGQPLPVPTVSADPNGAAAAALARTYIFPQSQNLGQLGASFGGTQVTPGGADRAAEEIRALRQQLATKERELAATKELLARTTTGETLLRQLAHIGDLTRGGIETLVQRTPARPSPRPPVPILGVS